MSNAQEHIQKIRKEKFWLDENGQLREKNPLIDDLTNSIERLSEGLYSKDTHFIFELIQNAEDNTYNEASPSLSFQLVKNDPTGTPNATGALIIQNNEVGFSPNNVNAICAIGKTTKSKIQGYIGEKGIGFKSVFRITTIPYIFSNGYQFCFPEKDKKTGLGYIVPCWIAKVPRGIDLRQTTIILPLDKPDFGYERINEMLQDIKPETTLFLSKLKEIQIKTDSGEDLRILKDDTKFPQIQILIKGKKEGESYSEVKEFLLFTQSVNRPQNVTHEKRVGIDKRDVTIAFPVDDNKDSMGKIFAYLPVRSDTGFPFLINADFILPSAREDISDVPWNRWLMKCVANLLADKLSLLREKSLLTVELLETFAKRMNELNENSIFYPIVEGVCNALLNQELLPTDKGTFVSARNAKLASADWLRKLLTSNQLRDLFSSQYQLNWLSSEITQKPTPNLRNYLINELDVEEVTPDSFTNRIEENFLAKQSNKWIIDFYKCLNKVPYLWKSNQHPPRSFRSKPIIRTEDDKLIAPYRHKCEYHNYGSSITEDQNDVFLPPEGETSFTIVKRCIVDDDDARQFLKDLGLKEPNIYDEIFRSIFPKYNSDSEISPEEHKKHINTILRAIRSGDESKRNNLIEKLKSLKFILAINSATNDCRYECPSSLYFKTEELNMFFEGNSDIWFINEELSENSTKGIFLDLGVSDSIKIFEKKDGLKDKRIVWESKHKVRGVNGFDYRCEISGLEHALDNPNFEKSQYIWNHILSEYSDSIKGFIESKETNKHICVGFIAEREVRYSEMGQLLTEKAWIPDKQGIFHRPDEIGLDDLPDTFQRNEKLADQLGMKKDVVAKLAEEAGVPEENIVFLKKHPEEFKKWKDTITAKKEKPSFPTRAGTNSGRRQEKLLKDIDEAPERQYEPRTRTVRITQASEYTRTWLKGQYTNELGQMICQICKEEMRFRKRDGEYYFVVVEALSRGYFTKEHEAQYLALCPLCAAMYNEFVKHDEEAMESLKNALMNSEDAEIPLKLGKISPSIRFVKTHFLDIQEILEAQK